MAGKVSVDSNAIAGGMKCCKVSLQEMELVTKKLIKSYEMAGASGWHDQKYTALGDIVDECCKAVKRPMEELEECMRKLQALQKAVEEYEETGI